MPSDKDTANDQQDISSFDPTSLIRTLHKIRRKTICMASADFLPSSKNGDGSS